MRLSDLGQKEIIDVSTGNRYGDLYEAELLFDEKKGRIRAILIPEYKGRFRMKESHEHNQISWDSIRKIGEDIIIVETQME